MRPRCCAATIFPSLGEHVRGRGFERGADYAFDKVFRF